MACGTGCLGARTVRPTAYLRQQPGPVATVNGGKHHSGEPKSAEGYGKHHAARADGLSAVELIERLSRAGYAVRLAWRGAQATNVVPQTPEFPTAILPVIRREYLDADEKDPEPPVTREAPKWLWPGGFWWRSKLLAG